MAWLGAFVLTQVVEAPLYAWSLRRWSTGPSWERALVAILPSAVTHPLLWLGFPPLRAHLSYVAAVGVAEALVVVVEAAVIARFLDPTLVRGPMASRNAATPAPTTPAARTTGRARRVGLALGVATAANALSVLVGLACRALFDWP